MKRMRKLVITPKTVSFEEAVAMGRQMLVGACADAAKILGGPAPEIITETLASGDVRMVVRWKDGQETNECVVSRTDTHGAFPA